MQSQTQTATAYVQNNSPNRRRSCRCVEPISFCGLILALLMSLALIGSYIYSIYETLWFKKLANHNCNNQDILYFDLKRGMGTNKKCSGGNQLYCPDQISNYTLCSKFCIEWNNAKVWNSIDSVAHTTMSSEVPDIWYQSYILNITGFILSVFGLISIINSMFSRVERRGSAQKSGIFFFFASFALTGTVIILLMISDVLSPGKHFDNDYNCN